MGQGQVGMQGAAPVLPSTQARQPTATSTRSSLILQTVSQKRLFFSDMKNVLDAQCKRCIICNLAFWPSSGEVCEATQ